VTIEDVNLFRRRPDPATRTVTLLGKPGCHLCDDARIVIERVTRELGVAWEEVDITTDPELQHTYWEQIPVTFVDGAQHDFWRVDEKRLRRALGG
jgi:glutaredoxin